MFQTDSTRSLYTPSLSPPHLLTQRFEVQGFQFLRHLFPPVAEPAVKVGRLEEMPLNLRREKKKKRESSYDTRDSLHSDNMSVIHY